MIVRLAADADHSHAATLERPHLGSRQAKGNEAIAFPKSIDTNGFDLVRRIDWCLNLPGLMKASVLQDAAIDVMRVASPRSRADADDGRCVGSIHGR